MPWLTPVVFKQGPDESLIGLPRFDDGPKKVRFRHIVHVYRDKATPENTQVQSITFDTIRQAHRFAEPDIATSAVMVAFAEDMDLIPPDMVSAPALIRQVGQIARFLAPRPLPLLFDVIRNGMAANAWRQPPDDAIDYVVYTNSDIHLQPFFYRALAALIRQGYDAISVNRRTIDVPPGSRAFSPLFMAEPGRDHVGFDCFAFPAAMLDRFAMNDACCGAGEVMRSLLFNLVAEAGRFLMLTHPQMTFHLGDDQHWVNPKFADYQHFNYHQALSAAATLARHPDKAKRLEQFIDAHEGQMYRVGFAGILEQARWFQLPQDSTKS
jgi:hypothetical protein